MDNLYDEGYSKDLTASPSNHEENLQVEIGKTESESPEWAEENRAREQMMAREILELQENHHNIIVIVGVVHTDEIRNQLSTLENKYNF